MKKLTKLCLMFLMVLAVSFSGAFAAVKGKSKKPVVKKPVVAKKTPVAPKATETPSAPLKKKFSERKFQFGLEERLSNSVGYDPLPLGFGITSSWSIGQKFSVQYSFIKQLALKFSYDIGKVDMESKFYGASMNTISISNPLELVLKVYPLDSIPSILPYVSFGMAHADISGYYSVGGFQFPRTGDGWSWVVDVGAEIPLDDNLFAASINYQFENFKVVSSVPGVGDLSSSVGGSLLFGFVVRPE